MLNDGYRIARLTEERLADLTCLHQAVYSKTTAPDFFKRKYNTAFTGIMYVGYLAYADNRPAAFYGVIPCFIKHDGQAVLAAQSADTMTHPDHRGKNLFITLAGLTYGLCKAKGIRVLFGFPNQNSLPGFVNKLSWQVIAYMECFVMPVKALPLAKLANKFPVLKNAYIGFVKNKLRSQILPQAGIENTVVNEDFSGVQRDQDYLNYKSAYASSYTIKVGHSTVWFKIQDGMVIGDINLALDDMNNMIPHLQKTARSLGLRKIIFQTDKRTVLNMLLKNHAQPIPSFPVIIKDLDSGLQLDKLAFTFADIDIF